MDVGLIKPLYVECSNCALSNLCKEYLFDKQDRFFINSLERKVAFKNGEVLCKPGQSVKYLIALRGGFVSIYDENDNIINFLMPGQLVGGEDIGHGFYRVKAVALTSLSTCLLDSSQLYGLSQVTSNSFHHIINLLSISSRENQRMISVLSYADGKKKIAAFLILLINRLKEYGFPHTNFTFPLPYKDIAQLLGLSVSTLHRVFRAMEAEFILETNNRDVLVINPKKLNKILSI